MDKQAIFVADASRDDSQIANSGRPDISVDICTPPAVTNARPSDVQVSSKVRMPPYSHAVPVVTATDATQPSSPNGQSLSSPATTRHEPTPRAVTAGYRSTSNVLTGSLDHLANENSPARSSQTKYARSSQPQPSSTLSTSAPSQASHDGKKPSATSAAFPVTASEKIHAGSSKNVLKRSFDHKNENCSSYKRSRGCANGVLNQLTAVQADDREWWDDARFDPPKDWDEVQALQEALAPTIRTFATISGRPSPQVSPWTPYGYQYRFLQRAMLENWKADRRLGNAPMLAGLCAWPGGVMAWRKARVHTSEVELLAYKHPSLLVPQIRPGSLLWYQNFDREWFQGDEEDRRRQDAIQNEIMHRDLGQRQATQAQARLEAVSAQIRPSPPAQRRGTPVNPRKRAINAQVRLKTEVLGQPVTEARDQGKEDATQPRADTSAPRQATPITFQKTSIEAYAPVISQNLGKDSTKARRGEGMRPHEDSKIQAGTRHQETVHQEESANREELRDREGETAAQPTKSYENTETRERPSRLQ
ncbi:hypothetical protein N7G274_010353 [Stereocaulon virgatum]|uniref:Uncharacterized protein n=1 Tax=Stereocaulon virgatum TaxID=373712 RepID=A0ABR3ZUJ7_9LECA